MSITVNKKAFHDYFIEEKFEAGIALEGWEVKAIRAGRMNIKESYVIIKNGEIFLICIHISPTETGRTIPVGIDPRLRGFAVEAQLLIVPGTAFDMNERIVRIMHGLEHLRRVGCSVPVRMTLLHPLAIGALICWVDASRGTPSTL